MVAAPAFPAHVPPERVVDIDIYNMPLSTTVAQLAWNCFKGKGSPVYSPRNGGHWIATDGADVLKFFRDVEHFSSRQIVIPDPGGGRLLPTQSDGTDHDTYRANIVNLFSVEQVEALTPKIRELTVALIEAFRARGGCELVSEFSLQLPLIVFLTRMGLPIEDRLFLRGHVEVFAGSALVEEKQAAHEALHRYIEKWIRLRTEQPGDDAVSRIISAKLDGRQYTQEEVIATLILLLLGGLDTVASSLSFIALHLAKNPADREYIRQNHAKLPAIIMELLRRFSVAGTGRVLAKDYTYNGVTMKKGDRMMLAPTFFNLDPARVANSEAVDFNRPAPNLTFGAGPHICAGIHLAKREITIFLEEWLQRIPHFELDPRRPPKLCAGFQSSVQELWLRW
jgi:cytochrome P450